MIIFIKNLTTRQIKIHTLCLGLQIDETRKIVANFDVEYQSAKNELDALLDDKKISLFDSEGSSIETPDIFKSVIGSGQNFKKNKGIITEELKEEKFYYLEDVFCIKKDNSVLKPFKGYVNTFKISTKQRSVKYRIISNGVVMPWQFIQPDKENSLNFEYRLKDPIFELYSDRGDANITIYLNGYVTRTSSKTLQDFIDTWCEKQNDYKNVLCCDGYKWSKNNKISYIKPNRSSFWN